MQPSIMTTAVVLALPAQLRAGRKTAFREGVPLPVLLLKITTLLIDELLLLLIQRLLRQHADIPQMFFYDMAQLGDNRRHESAPGLPVAAPADRIPL